MIKLFKPPTQNYFNCLAYEPSIYDITWSVKQISDR